MENYSFLFYVVGIILLFLVLKSFSKPISKIIKLLINSILGAGIIYGANFIGAGFNFHIGLNWITIVSTGILGIPGIVLIFFLKIFAVV